MSVMAAESLTTVTVQYGHNNIPADTLRLNSGQTKTWTLLSAQLMYIQSDKPIHVTQLTQLEVCSPQPISCCIIDKTNFKKDLLHINMYVTDLILSRCLSRAQRLIYKTYVTL